MARKVQVEITGDSRDLKRAFDDAGKSAQRFAGEVKGASRSARADLDEVGGAFDKLRTEGRGVLTGRGFRQAASGALKIAGGAFVLTTALEGAAAASSRLTGENSQLTQGLGDASNAVRSLMTLDIAGFIDATQAASDRGKKKMDEYNASISNVNDTTAALEKAKLAEALGWDKAAEAIRKHVTQIRSEDAAMHAIIDLQREYNTTILDGTKYLVAFKGAHDSAFPGTVAGEARALPTGRPFHPDQHKPLSPSERRNIALIGTEGTARLPILNNYLAGLLKQQANFKGGHEQWLALLTKIKETYTEIGNIQETEAARIKAANEDRAREAERLKKERAARARAAKEAALVKEQARQYRLIGLSPEGGEVIPTKANLSKQLEQLRGRKADIPAKMFARFAGIAKALKQDLTPETRAAIRDFFRMVRSEFDRGSELLKPVALRGVNTNQILGGLNLTPSQARRLRNRLAGVNVKGQALARSSGTGAFGVNVGGTTVVTSDVYLDGEKVGRVNRRFSQRGAINSPKQKRGPNAGR